MRSLELYSLTICSAHLPPTLKTSAIVPAPVDSHYLLTGVISCPPIRLAPPTTHTSPQPKIQSCQHLNFTPTTTALYIELDPEHAWNTAGTIVSDRPAKNDLSPLMREVTFTPMLSIIHYSRPGFLVLVLKG